MLQRPLRREGVQKGRRHRDQRDIHTSDSGHRSFLVVRDHSTAVAEHDAKSVIECNQVGNRSFRNNARIIGAAFSDFIALGYLFFGRRRRCGLERIVERLRHIFRRLTVAAKNRFDFVSGEFEQFTAATGHGPDLFRINGLGFLAYPW